jgi:hypothetical protein
VRLGHGFENTLKVLNAERITADIARAYELQAQRERDHIMTFDAGYIASDADLAQQQAAADDPYAGEEEEPTQEELDAAYQDLKDGKIYVPDAQGNPINLKFPEDDLDPAAPHGGSDDDGSMAVSNMIRGFVAKGNMHKTPEPEESQEDKQHIPQDPEDLSPRIRKIEKPKEDPRDKLIKDLQTQLAESEQMRKNTVAAKDKILTRNRELEAENETLKQHTTTLNNKCADLQIQLEELQAKLAQYEGMGA